MLLLSSVESTTWHLPTTPAYPTGQNSTHFQSTDLSLAVEAINVVTFGYVWICCNCMQLLFVQTVIHECWVCLPTGLVGRVPCSKMYLLHIKDTHRPMALEISPVKSNVTRFGPVSISSDLLQRTSHLEVGWKIAVPTLSFSSYRADCIKVHCVYGCL